MIQFFGCFGFAGWDLVYDNGFIEIDPSQCGYSTFLGAGIPEPEEDEQDEEGEEEHEDAAARR